MRVVSGLVRRITAACVCMHWRAIASNQNLVFFVASENLDTQGAPKHLTAVNMRASIWFLFHILFQMCKVIFLMDS